MHIPFDKFTEEKAEELVKLLIEKESVVFLCMYSKQPGPSCASDYARMRVKYVEDNAVQKQQTVKCSNTRDSVI